MNLFSDTQKQISPCIVSKVKLALNLKSDKPDNIKFCSKNYWVLAIKSIANEYKINDDSIVVSAIEKYDMLINNI